MKKIITIIAILIAQNLCQAQDSANETQNFSFNLTNYFFTYTYKYESGTFAIGPTCTINTHGKFQVQVGFLQELRTYTEYSVGGTPYDLNNVYYPLFFQYHYLKKEKISLNIISGIMFGGRWTLRDNNRAGYVSGFNLYCGTGITYRVFKFLSLGTSVSMRYNRGQYNEGYFYPGLLLDISFLFNKE